RTAAISPITPPAIAPITAEPDEREGHRARASARTAPASRAAMAMPNSVTCPPSLVGLHRRHALRERAFDAAGFVEDQGRRVALNDRVLELWVVQRRREARQQVEVSANRRAYQQEDRRHRLSVDRSEVDFLFEKTERDGRCRHVEHDRIADVRDRDAIPD